MSAAAQSPSGGDRRPSGATRRDADAAELPTHDATDGASVTTTSILIAALGGEGGGVLAEWLVQAAQRAGLPVQATSVPGVAQRTGSTSYYIEFLRTPAPAGRRPVFALMPVPGRVDVVLASELLEGVRMVERGFVDPVCTLLVTARHRVLTTLEKMAMADGRFDDERLLDAAAASARHCLALDLQAIAQRHRTVISAVLYGALAGSGRLPWPREIDEAVIRASGLGVTASLAGYAEAHAAAQGALPIDAAAALPASLADIVQRADERLRDYQDAGYARHYRERVDSLRAAAAGASGGDAEAEATRGRAIDEAARHLALWMSYEDVIRVADLKTRRERFDRVRAEAMAGPGDIVRIHEHLSPGLDEIAAIAPRRLGLALRRRVRRDAPVGARGRGMTLETSSVHGFVLLRVLASLRRWRPRSLRWAEEQAAIDAWLAALRTALPRHAGYAEALAELPRLRKGYSDTFERGRDNYERIAAALVSPCVADPARLDDAAAARLRQAIAAALADPEQQTIDRLLPRPAGEQPVVWHARPQAGASTPSPRDSPRPIGTVPGP